MKPAPGPDLENFLVNKFSAAIIGQRSVSDSNFTVEKYFVTSHAFKPLLQQKYKSMKKNDWL